MVSSISSIFNYVTGGPQQPQQPPPSPTKTAAPQDTAHLSRAAQASAGDADHGCASH